MSTEVAVALAELKVHTPARIAQSRAGTALATQELLAFGLAHAQARDAVHTPLEVAALGAALQAAGWQSLAVQSSAPDRHAYLARPDWGRRLAPASADALRIAAPAGAPPDLVLVLSDGLSATALQRHALPLLQALLPLLGGLRIAPLVIATQARVALADEVGALWQARCALSLIGERPGLSSPDSLGAYLTHAPRPGRSDAERNCVSNIRPQGLGYAEAAAQLAGLIRAALAQQCSGVNLRFNSGNALPAESGS